MNSAFLRVLGRLFSVLALASGLLLGAAESSRATDLAIDSIPLQKVPCGKTLVVPVAANGDGPLNFTVKSSDARLIPLVKTGNPFLKISVSYAGNGVTSGSTASLAFSGDLIFELFRDSAPKTIGYIGGFAQAGYYDNVLTPIVTGSDAQVTGTYNSSIFHRIANLTGTSAPVYIAQGGDPDANNPSTSGTLTHGPGFAFDNEFDSPLIFAGRGQLAMANSGANGYRGTNGSQFFISQGPLRHLDFKHTIFGQLVRDEQNTLDKIMAVPVVSSTTNKPVVDVVIDSVSLVNDPSDAVLLISSAGLVSGTATVTVTARDPAGNTVSRAIPVTTYAETVNDPPFLGPLPSVVVPYGKPAIFAIGAQDLESDYLIASAAILASAKAKSAVKGNIATITPNPGSAAQRADVGVSLSFWGGSSTADREQTAVGLGVRSLVPLSTTLHVQPGQPIANQVVATFRAAQVSGSLGNFSATINWGDGTALSSGSAVSVTRTRSPANGFAVSGSHTYASAGQYSLIVSASDSIGATVNITTPVIVSDGPLVALGRDLSVNGGAISGREIATFTDTDPAAKPSDYTVMVDWGDGVRAAAAIHKSARGFSVIGTHQYSTNTNYSVRTEVAKTSSAATAVGWGFARVRGVNSTHLPPFPIPHIVGQLYSVTQTSGTSFSTGFVLLNCGKKASGPVTLKFSLTDQIFGQDPDIPLQVQSFVPPIGGLKPNLPFSFFIGRLLFPPGVTSSTSLKQIKMQVFYSDPLGDAMAFSHEFLSDYLQ
jgi:cyclophilin family peptidyl-prolyl cis-trans isomerase